MAIKKLIGLLTTKNVILFISLRLKLKRALITPFKKTHIFYDKLAKVTGPGELLFGIQWENGAYETSQLILRRNSELKINDKFLIYSGASIWVNEGAQLSLGSGYINNKANISCYSSITIGENVAISENVTIRDSDNHCLNNQPATKPVTIGDHVWIGINSTILKGVTVGAGSIIAAGSVVVKDVPEQSLVAGIPAKVIKNNISWK